MKKRVSTSKMLLPCITKKSIVPNINNPPFTNYCTMAAPVQYCPERSHFVGNGTQYRFKSSFISVLYCCYFSGLLSFYKVMTFIYFITASLYGQRLWQTISKGGPMHQVW